MLFVADILRLDLFKEARLISGKGGLGNEIKFVSVIEMPINTEFSKKLVGGNEFYITGLFAYHNEAKGVIHLFEQLIYEECSGVCIIDAHIDLITEDVIKLTNENNFPIIVVSRKIPYYKLLEKIFKELIASKTINSVIKELDSVPLDDNNKSEVSKIAKTINPSFFQYNCSIYITTSLKANLVYLIKCNSEFCSSEFLITEYKDGYVIILTFNNHTINNYNDIIKKLINIISSKTCDYHIGLSMMHEDLGELKYSINEAVESNMACSILKKNILNYEDIGILKVLFQLKNNKELEKFKDSIINSIKEYGKNKGIDLYETAVKFIECDGNFNKTSKMLFIHVNTVRYRIDIIKALLKKDNSIIDFYESLSIAIKAEKMLNILDLKNKNGK